VQRIVFLDVLRGLAALTVVAYHALAHISAAFITFSRQQFDLGRCAVVIFFLCSGFIIPATIERQASVWRFLVRRVCRIYPLYWFSLALYLVYDTLARSTPGQILLVDWHTASPIATLLANAALLQHVLRLPNLVPNSWTLTYELLFYGFVALLFASQLLPRIVSVTMGLILLSVIFRALIPRWGGIELDALGSTYYLALMSIGAVAQRVAVGAVRPHVAVRCALLLLVAENVSLSTGQAGWLADVVALALFGIAYGLRASSFPRLCRELGQVSYSVYLLHEAVIASVPRLISVPLALLVWMGSTLLAAVITERWIERPGIALGRWLTRPWTTAPGTRGVSRPQPIEQSA
jgi:peptidoglycan/LPS O-acetylase OafA/YrhL